MENNNNTIEKFCNTIEKEVDCLQILVVNNSVEVNKSDSKTWNH